MAHLQDFEHDVFISYAHIDNTPDREGERGWVDRFERALSLRLLKRFGRAVRVWRDPEIARSQRFDPVIEAALKGSAIMVSLISKSYLTSPYCRQEVESFVAKVAQDPFGLVLDHHVRVFPVLLYNIPPHEWPEPCRATSGFRFHDAIERGFGKPLDPDQDDFIDQLCNLVEEIHSVLGALQRQAEDAAQPAVAPTHPRTVFLAEVSDDQRRDRRHLRLQLEKEGVEVVSGIPPPDAAPQHEAAVVEALRRARLSVHLLGALPGRPIDEDQPDKTYPTEQVRIALEHARSQLVVLPPGLEPEDVQEPGYASLVSSLQTREREAERFEILQVSRAQLAQEVVSKLGRLEAEEASRRSDAARSTNGNAFIDLHVNDLPLATDLVGYLHRKGLPAVTIPSGDLDPATGLSLFEEHLKRSRVFIVVFGRVARNWVEHRLNEAFKLILSDRLTTRVGVYLAPPRKSKAEVVFPPFFRVMNNTDRFDPSTVDELLREAAGVP